MEKGSLFYTLHAQVLDDKNLNHAEKLIMTILSGLAHDDGTCYPSNEWLGEKLDRNDRQIREILEKLELNNYIRREIVSCVKNPFKKYRIIHISTNFKLFLPEAKNRRIDSAKNRRVDRRKIAGRIYKKEVLINKKEKKKEIRKKKPPAAAAAGLSLLFFEAVKKSLPKTEYKSEWQEQLDEFEKTNPPKLSEVLDWLPTNEFYRRAAKTAKSFIKNYEAMILEMEADRDRPQNRSKASLNLLESIKKSRELRPYLSSGEIDCGTNYVCFRALSNTSRPEFHVTDKDFVEKVTQRLAKMGIDPTKL